MELTITDYLLLALLLFAILTFPLMKKFLSLAELFVKQYVQTSAGRRQGDFSREKMMLNLRLMAYERIVLFIERMKPDSLVPRVLLPTLTNREFHQLLLTEIRKEYEYNMSQQLYMSEEAWHMVTNLKNSVISLINTAATECKPDQPATGLARKTLEMYIASDVKIDDMLRALRAEAEK